MSDIERRAVTVEAAELRAEEGTARLAGYAAIFGSRTDLGYFSEEIAPGAFSGVLGDDVRALFNHSPDHVLGRTKSGTLRIGQDDRGLRYEVDLNPDDPDAMQLYSRVKRGDISGSSFSFTVAEEAWDYEQDPPHRTIQRLGQLFDVAPVTFPAYDAAMVSARAKDAAAKERAPVETPKPVSHEARERMLDLQMQE
ncbi:MAG: HK97 family phage prohead protease [Vicinamibacterales bacterium]